MNRTAPVGADDPRPSDVRAVNRVLAVAYPPIVMRCVALPG